MALSLYEATVPQFLQILPGVMANLDRAEAWAKERGLSDAEILGKRLAPDMHPLASQFRWAAQHSAGAIRSVFAGIIRPDQTPPPEDFATLRGILTDALSYVQGVDANALEAVRDKDVNLEYAGAVRLRFSGTGCLLSFALPNFYFHTSMAYAILRNLGLEIGKADFIGPVQTKQIA